MHILQKYIYTSLQERVGIFYHSCYIFTGRRFYGMLHLLVEDGLYYSSNYELSTKPSILSVLVARIWSQTKLSTNQLGSPLHDSPWLSDYIVWHHSYRRTSKNKGVPLTR
jgi:hypothetical protein